MNQRRDEGIGTYHLSLELHVSDNQRVFLIETDSIDELVSMYPLIPFTLQHRLEEDQHEPH